MTNSLPPYDKVFFVHYQCENFNVGEQIFNMCVSYNNKVKQFDADNEPDEATMIADYCTLVKKYCDEGLLPVHWNQNAKYYGIDHICSRYKALTGNSITLDYPGEIDLASLLIEVFGDDYVPHPRFDSLATLNNLKGHSSESASRTFPTQRTQLLSKVYHKLLNNKLIIGELSQNAAVKAKVIASESDKNPTKTFYDFLLHSNKVRLAAAIKNEFTTEKGKTIRFMIEAMKQMNPPLLACCIGEKKALHDAMKLFFCHKIGSYQSIFDYKFSTDYDAANVEAMKVRLNFILEQLK
jgi:hypothetical protein